MGFLRRKCLWRNQKGLKILNFLTMCVDFTSLFMAQNKPHMLGLCDFLKLYWIFALRVLLLMPLSFIFIVL
jgi:hypothetical protein